MWGSSWRTEPAAALRGLAKRGSPPGRPLLVYLGEALPGHPQGYGADGAQVLGHVLPPEAVPPGGPRHQPALLVGQGYGEAVNLQLADIIKAASRDEVGDPFVPGPELGVGKGIGQGG